MQQHSEQDCRICQKAVSENHLSDHAQLRQNRDLVGIGAVGKRCGSVALTV